MTYGREALRRLRERQECAVQEPERQTILLEQIPEDAPTDDAVLTVWNGELWVAYQKWLANAPLAVDAKPREERNPAIPADAECVAGSCGGVRIWLVGGGERWLMFVGSRKAGGRRRDFASPFLAHAIRTAEAWYGAPGDGWRADDKRDGEGPKA